MPVRRSAVRFIRCLRATSFVWLVVSTALHSVDACAETTRPAKPRLGINLSGPCDWNTELPLVDLFRFSRTWISQREGAAWGSGPPLAVDAHGWVTKLEKGCFAETFLCAIEDGHYPAGEYTVFYDGEGTFGGSGAVVSVVNKKPGRITFVVDPKKGPLAIRLMTVNPKNYVRNIRVVQPGYTETYEANPWESRFLERWRGVAALRFMDWMQTNNSKIATWSQRPTLEDASFADKGLPVELMVDLANRLEADPWFCMPHLADDEFVRNFAMQVKTTLDPERRIYIEYSNEVWNSMFSQSAWAGEQGMKLGFADKPWEAAWKYTAYRSMQIFAIWEEVFGGTERLVRVLGSQAANPYVSEVIVGFQDAYKHADALAIAPYLSCSISPADAHQVLDASLDDLMHFLETKALSDSLDWIVGQKKVADTFGLTLVAYEGGQHLVGIQGGENIDAMTARFHEANAHPAMGALYRKYLVAWMACGGDLFCHFSSVGQWSKWGSWGSLQYADEDPAQSPKFTAMMNWAKQRGQNVAVPGAR